jgi:heptosyltransferase-2
MKILVRAPNWIGDSILAVPSLQSLSQNHPEAEIWVLARGWVKDLFVSYPFIRGVIPLPDRADLKTLRRTAQELKGEAFDTGLLLTNSFGSALLFALARIPNRWGYATDGRRFLLTRGVRPRAPGKTIHQAQHYLDLVSRLGMEAVAPSLSFPLGEEEVRGAEGLLASEGVSSGSPLTILNPGGYFGSAKRWPPERFGALAALLQEREGARVVIVGSQGEAPLARLITDALLSKPLVLTGRTSLRQLAAVISLADLFVTNDSGPMHLANALGTPVLALFGPTDPEATAPFQEPSAYLHKAPPCWPCAYRDCPIDHRCMESISPEEVYGLSRRWLPS